MHQSRSQEKKTVAPSYGERSFSDPNFKRHRERRLQPHARLCPHLSATAGLGWEKLTAAPSPTHTHTSLHLFFSKEPFDSRYKKQRKGSSPPKKQEKPSTPSIWAPADTAV